MRTGIYGGTFNPVHNGHVKLAKAYVSALNLDRLLVIPANIPPHKTSSGLIDGKHRLAMCKLAFSNQSVFTVCDLELKRESKSFTVDTLEQLNQLYPDDRFYLIMGSDMFCSLTHWHQWQKIIQLAVICAGARHSNFTDHNLLEQRQKLESLGANCELVEFEPLAISSTMIRQQIQTHKSIDKLVAPAVAEYIDKYKLYR